jgi:hypothetical protein
MGWSKEIFNLVIVLPSFFSSAFLPLCFGSRLVTNRIWEELVYIVMMHNVLLYLSNLVTCPVRHTDKRGFYTVLPSLGLHNHLPSIPYC